jgi:hypothetical protein
MNGWIIPLLNLLNMGAGVPTSPPPPPPNPHGRVRGIAAAQPNRTATAAQPSRSVEASS